MLIRRFLTFQFMNPILHFLLPWFYDLLFLGEEIFLHAMRTSHVGVRMYPLSFGNAPLEAPDKGCVKLLCEYMEWPLPPWCRGAVLRSGHYLSLCSLALPSLGQPVGRQFLRASADRPSESMDDIWPPPPPELYQINVLRSNIKARKILEQMLLRPLSQILRSNVTSEVIWRS